MADKRGAPFQARFDARTQERLAALAKKLELPRSLIVRQAIKRMAEQEGVEVSDD